MTDGESQVIELPNGESLYIQGFQFSWIKLVFLIFISVVTLFLGLWMISRRPFRLVRWLHTQVKLSKATHMVLKVYRPGQEKSTVVWKAVGKGDDQRWFTWRNFRLTWCYSTQKFKRVHYIDESNLSLSEIHDLVKNIDNIHYRSR